MQTRRAPVALLAALTMATLGGSTDAAVDGLDLRLRSRVEDPQQKGRMGVVEVAERWEPGRTAIIVCDMWDLHHCLNAVRREGEMAPRMDRVLRAARDRGVAIIHAPSGCTDTYKDHPARKHATGTPRAGSFPAEIARWCYKIPAEEKGVYPIDQTDGGEDDDPAEHEAWQKKLAGMGRNPKAPWKSQTDALGIDDGDYISDSGEEIWSILADRRIDNVVLMGVHLNMCVLGRPFGLRQMAKNGKHVVLMRDMTDTMYNPKRSPQVSHFAGTDLMIEHVETHVCPTITSDQILGGRPSRFRGDDRPNIAFVIAEDEYRTEFTLPAFASAHLGKDFHAEYILGGARGDLPGVGLLDSADAAVISVRRRPLPRAQLDAIRAFVGSGKPVVGIRTASHAFSPKGGARVPDGSDAWTGFDADILGGNYQGHHRPGPAVATEAAPGATSHPILEGVDPAKLVGHGSLYKVSPIAKTATPLLIGSIPGQAPEPVAWVNAPVGRGRVFYTSLGQADDFGEADFNRLLRNAIAWAVGPGPGR